MFQLMYLNVTFGELDFFSSNFSTVFEHDAIYKKQDIHMRPTFVSHLQITHLETL